MENLCDLLFEISNEDRLRILHWLNREKMNVTKLSRELDLTTQESSRHLSRLIDVRLVEKGADGLHCLTPYGELILRQLPGLEFTSRHRDYFREHTLTNLPTEFVLRIGELEGSTYIDDVMVAVHSVEETLLEAEEYILNINVPYIASAFPLVREAYERGVTGRFIHTRELIVPPSMREERERVFDDDIMKKIWTSGLQEERLVEEMGLILYMSEKSVGILAFPLKDGRFDFLGFRSESEGPRRWCRDLFYYYWERAEPEHIVP